MFCLECKTFRKVNIYNNRLHLYSLWHMISGLKLRMTLFLIAYSFVIQQIFMENLLQIRHHIKCFVHDYKRKVIHTLKRKFLEKWWRWISKLAIVTQRDELNNYYKYLCYRSLQVGILVYSSEVREVWQEKWIRIWEDTLC